MNEHSVNTDLLIQYLDGELQGEELQSIKNTIENNPTLLEELENLRIAREAVGAYGLRKQIQSIHPEMMRELKEKTKPGTAITRMIFQYSFRVAAILIILFGISALYQYYTGTPEKLFSEKFQAFELRELRGVSGNHLEDLYKAGNTGAVITRFNNLSNPLAEDYFLAGNAFLNSHQPKKAIEAFLNLQQINNSSNQHLFEEDTEYYLALAYLDNGQVTQALPIMEKIHVDPSHPYNRQVGNWFILKLKRLSTH